MNKVNKKLIIPAILATVVYILAYQIPKNAVDSSSLHFLYISLDDKIPFIPYFIYIYIGAFFQWAYSLYILTKQKTEIGYKACSAIIIGSIIGFCIFIIYPTGIYRPEIVGHTFSDDFCRFIYSVDSIICACPSFHCFCSTIVILIYKKCENISSKFININIVISILVFASTLLVKQHYIADILPGILLAYISMYISNKLTFTKQFDYLNKRFFR